MPDTPSHRTLLKTFLSGIETGSAMAASVVDETTYIQHNPQTREGGPGIAELFARIAKTDPKVTFLRVFEDGDYAFAHIIYDFADVKIAFELFRFENGKAVEHWDNLQPVAGPNASGRSMTDGATAITALDQTEANRARAREFAQTVLVGGQTARIAEFTTAELIQHAPDIADGAAALMSAVSGDAPLRRYHRLHRVFAEGNFTLCQCEGARLGVHAGIYDLCRWDAGRIVEHWSTVEPIPPRDLWKNDNGKF